MANDQSRAPDAIRDTPTAEDIEYTKTHYDFDLDGHLFAGKDIKVVDCGNVIANPADHEEHYRLAELAARRIFSNGTIPIALGGDHGVPIPVMRALDVLDKSITLVHVDAHLDGRDEVNGEKEGYSSPVRRASEMPWIDKIVQTGLRGMGSARAQEVADARAYGADLISADEMHTIGMVAVLEGEYSEWILSKLPHSMTSGTSRWSMQKDSSATLSVPRFGQATADEDWRESNYCGAATLEMITNVKHCVV